MDQMVLPVLIGAAAIGLLAVILILARQRSESKPTDSPYAASTEGMKVCPHCSRPNLWTDSRCLYCGSPLPG